MFQNTNVKPPKQVYYMSRKIYPKSPPKPIIIQKKIVIRKLPPDMELNSFIDQVSPIPAHDYMYFVKADKEYGKFAYSRAYINFLHENDMYSFKEKYDGYVFLSRRGNEYEAVVEFAPFSRIPKRNSRRYKDQKVGTIENNTYYQAFVKSVENPPPKPVAKDFTEIPTNIIMSYLKPTENKTKKTPLLSYLAKKKEENSKVTEEKWKYVQPNKKYREHYSYICFNSSRQNLKRPF